VSAIENSARRLAWSMIRRGQEEERIRQAKENHPRPCACDPEKLKWCMYHFPADEYIIGEALQEGKASE
jgi:hypothetical protein